MKHSKVLAKIVTDNPHAFSEYYCDSDGHWMYTVSGVIVTAMQCGTVHEHTVKDAIAMIKCGIEQGVYVDGFSERVENPEMLTIKF